MSLQNPEELQKLQKQLTVLVLLCILGFVLAQLGLYFADLLRILGISFLLSYLVINIVDFLDKYLNNRALAVVFVYIILLGICAVAAIFVVPAIVYQVAGLITTTLDRIPDWLHSADQALQPLQHRFQENRIDIKIVDVLTNFAAQLPKPDPAAVVTRLTDMAMSTMTWSVYAVSISVVTFYFLLDGHLMKDAVIKLFPEDSRPVLNQMANEIDTSLQSFFKGQLVLGILFGIVMLVVYLVLGVQYALLLSAFLALCEILPVIGPPIGFAPALIAVAIHGTLLPGARVVHVIVLTAIFMILQQVKDNVVAPRYIGNVIGLHPIMIFIAIMVGARLDGMLGIIFALPAACVLNVLFNHLPLIHNIDPAAPQPVVAPVATSEDATAGGDANRDR